MNDKTGRPDSFSDRLGRLGGEISKLIDGEGERSLQEGISEYEFHSGMVDMLVQVTVNFVCGSIMRRGEDPDSRETLRRQLAMAGRIGPALAKELKRLIQKELGVDGSMFWPGSGMGHA